MSTIAKVQYAKVSVGYDDFILPLKDATKLVELLSSLVPVERVEYALYSEFMPELEDKFVAKKKGLNVKLELIEEQPLPYFDQQARLALERIQKYGPQVLPFTLHYKGSKWAVLDPEGVELMSDYSFSDVLKHAEKQKQRYDEMHQHIDTGANKLTDGTSDITEVQFTQH